MIAIAALSVIAIAFICSYDCSSAENEGSYTDPSGGCTYSYDAESSTATVVGYDESVKSVTILSKIVVNDVDYNVTSIDADVFKGKSIESLTIQEGLTAIPNNEFEGCIKLKIATIPRSVTSIGDSAFKGCTALETVTITVSDDDGDMSRNLGISTFEDCSSLKNVTFHPSLSLNKKHACFKNTGLESVKIYLGSFSTATTVYIRPNELFMNCDKLSSVEIDYGDKTGFYLRGDSIFAGCKALKTFPFPTDENFNFYGIAGRYVFKDSGLETVYIPHYSMTSSFFVGTGTFDGCESLKHVVLGHPVAFDGTLPSPSETTFDGCHLTDLVLTTNSLDFRAFKNCTIDNLKLSKVKSVSVPSSGEIDKDFSIKNVDLGELLSDSLSGIYKDDEQMAIMSKIPGLESITMTGENAKYGVFGGGVYRLDYYNESASTEPLALIICSPDVTSVEVSGTVTTIGANAFNGCKRLTTVSFPESLTGFSYAGSDVSFLDGKGAALGEEIENYAGRTFMAKSDVDGLCLCPIITFTADGKEVGKTVYTWDGKAEIPDVPVKTGYAGTWGDFSSVTEDTEIKAVYTPNKHTVTYLVNGKPFGEVETHDFGSEVTVRSAYAADGYESTAWAVDGVDVADGKFTLGDADVVFTATSIMVVAADPSGSAEITLTGEENKFKVSEGTKVLNLNVAENTSVKVLGASDLAGKTVISEIKAIAGTSGIAGKSYEFVFTADGTPYGGTMQVTLPYVGEDGKGPAVYFWDGSKSTRMNIISSTDTSVTFETDHNSEYIVASEEFTKEGFPSSLLYFTLAMALAIMVVVIFGLNYYRREV